MSWEIVFASSSCKGGVGEKHRGYCVVPLRRQHHGLRGGASLALVLNVTSTKKSVSGYLDFTKCEIPNFDGPLCQLNMPLRTV